MTVNTQEHVQLVSDSVRVRAVDVLKTCDTQNIPMP